MRAILLQKDDYGLQKDRLHGRYGLTGKPTLTQTSVAGSLGASFKAGQTVALDNLRSLTAKIKEAQLAMSGASSNIDKIAESTSNMTDKSGEASKLIEESAWKRFWNGEISPETFYAIKLQEDEFNERMAGEPGFPCVDPRGIIDSTIIPRTAYYDTFFTISEHSVDAEKTLGNYTNSPYWFYLDKDLRAKIAESMSVQELIQQMQQVKLVTNIVFTVYQVWKMVSAGDTAAAITMWAVDGLLKVLKDYFIDYVINYLINDLLKDGKVTELGINKNTTKYAAETFSRYYIQQASLLPTYLNMFAKTYMGNSSTSSGNCTNWANVAYFDPTIRSIVAGLGAVGQTISTTMTIATALYSVGRTLSYSPIPAIAAVGKAIKYAASITVNTFNIVSLPSLYLLPLCNVSMYIAAALITRTKGNGRIYNSVDEFDITPETPYKSQWYTSCGEFDEVADTGVDLFGAIRKLMSIFGSVFSWLGFTEKPSSIYNSGFDEYSSAIYMGFNTEESVYDYRDLEGNEDFNFGNVSYDETPCGLEGQLGVVAPVGNNTRVDCKADKNNGFRITARYYPKDIYKQKITFESLLGGWRVVAKNVSPKGYLVIKSHFITSSNYEYFSEAVFYQNPGIDKDFGYSDNDFLLHHERNAIYYRGTIPKEGSILTHAEQVYWGVDPKKSCVINDGKNMIASQFFSYRSGVFGYAYADMSDGTRIQYRTMDKEPKINSINDLILSREYSFQSLYKNSSFLENSKFDMSVPINIKAYCTHFGIDKY